MPFQTTVCCDDLILGLRAIGLRRGDVLLFHSSMRSFGWVEGGPDTVIDAALASVGPRGTVVVPTFVQKFHGRQGTYRERREQWDIEQTPSDVGLIPEVFRKRPGAVRSNHCCCSLSALGAEAAEAMARHDFSSGRPSPWDDRAYGVGSPWDWLRERNALYLLMGVDFNRCTLLHYVQALWLETHYQVPSRPLTPEALDTLIWPSFDFPIMGERLRWTGLVRETWVGRSQWLAFRVAPFVATALKIMEEEPWMISDRSVRLYLYDSVPSTL